MLGSRLRFKGFGFRVLGFRVQVLEDSGLGV